MFRLTAKARLAMGMAMLVVTLLMIINMTGLVPDHRKTAMDARCALSEMVALQIRPVILEKDLDRLKGLLDAVVKRNDEILAGAIRRGDGKIVAMVGDHGSLWDTQITVNDDRQIYVPLNADGEDWGRVEICFTPLVRRGMIGLLDSPNVRMATTMGLCCWIIFYFYLRRMLSHLDPSRTVPGRVRNAYDALGDGLLVLDRDFRIRLINRSLAESIGTAPKKLIGKEAAKMRWVRDGNDEEFPWARTLKEGRTIQGEMLRYEIAEDHFAVFQVSCSPVPGSDGSPKGVLVSLDDVTELESTKQQLKEAKDSAEAANHAKSSFLANMSHEIRTPMNAILGFTEVLRRDIEHDEDKRRKHLNTIHTSGTHLLNLINDILDLSKVEADRLEVESIPCAVHRVVADVVTVMHGRAEEKGITLDYQFDGPIPESINSDPARLRQVITNLVGNAIKFTEKGGVRIVTKFVDDTGLPQMMIQVVDTGIGMSEGAAAKIFDPFSQADATVTRRFGGTGLGLSISKRFAEALGGGIRVISEEGVGSVFVVTINTGSVAGVAMITPTEADLEALVDDDQHLALELPEIRVLLVDDGEENRDLMSIILAEAGTTYATAENGLEAVKLATEQEWDVILMDMNMPVMDGYTATRKLREQGYDKPIIALTAHAMQQAEKRCRDAGCSGFLSKPINFDELITTLAEIANVDVAPTDRPAGSRRSGEQTVADSATESDSPRRDPIRSTLNTNNPKFLAIVAKFTQRLPEQLDQMTKALEEQDFDRLADLAHWLKGSGPNVGFADFGGPARELEETCRARDEVAATAAIKILYSLQDRLVDEDGMHRELLEDAFVAEPCTMQTTKLSSNQQDETTPIVSTLPLNKPRFREIVERFIARLDERFDAMDEAAEAGNLSQLAELGHWLKGASANCGFATIAEAASRLEQAALCEDPNSIRSVLDELRSLHARIDVPTAVTFAPLVPGTDSLETSC